MKKDKDKPNYVQRYTKKEDSNIMMKKNHNCDSMMYTSDNVPLFMFLLAVPLVNLLAIFLSKL